MKKFNKNTIKYIACSVLGVFIFLYFIYQVVQMNTNPYKTEVAVERKVENKITTKAFAIRDEEYITTENTSGTVVSIAEDGKRVASGDAVAVVFQSADSAATYVRINELEQEIAYYRQLKNRVGIGTNAPSSYNDSIDNACVAFIAAARKGINSDFNEALTDFRDSVTARQLAVGTQLSVDAKLSSLEAELVTLKGQSLGFTTVASPNPGYYIGSVDGFEHAIAYKDVLNNLGCEAINNLLSFEKQAVSGNVMGKLVDSFDWYFVCNVPYSESGKLRQDKKVSVNIPNTAVGSIECKIAYIGAKEGDFIPVVLKCNVMNRDVANLRIEDIEIITDQFTGIRINNKAIREVDGVKGVYVLRGNIIQFKKINIISSSEEYSIVEKVDDSSYIKQYDTVITEGVDLYDQKVIS